MDVDAAAAAAAAATAAVDPGTLELDPRALYKLFRYDA